MCQYRQTYHAPGLVMSTVCLGAQAFCTCAAPYVWLRTVSHSFSTCRGHNRWTHVSITSGRSTAAAAGKAPNLQRQPVRMMWAWELTGFAQGHCVACLSSTWLSPNAEDCTLLRAADSSMAQYLYLHAEPLPSWSFHHMLG